MNTTIPRSMGAELAGAGLTISTLTELIGPDAVEQLAQAYAADERQAAIHANPQLMLIAARWTVQVLGWPVFPLQPRGKEPLGGHGFYDATTDLAAVERIWQRHPTANIGVPTGVIGLDVIDVDGAEGLASLAAAEEQGLIPQPVAVAITGRPDGGRHLYIPAHPSRKNTTSRNRNGMPPGIDTRARGGYVVIPPSLHPSGNRYRWFTPPPSAAQRQQQGERAA